MFEKIKDYFTRGLWDLTRVKNVVGRAITAEEYEMITGDVFEED